MTPVRLALVLLASAPGPLVADDAPLIQHQPGPCTVYDEPISLCASVSDEGQVAKARVYFRAAEDKYYSFVDMTFGGLSYCGTLPAPREKKIQVIEYYVQAVDDKYQASRTSTFQMSVKAPGTCEFPPLEPDKNKSIVVNATNKKQGKKLPDEFDRTRVTFVPVAD